MSQANDYDYISAGYDEFFNRSVDKASQINLDSKGVQSQSIAYDRTQVSGMMGDTLQIGKIKLENTRIVINDGSNDFLLLGEDVK